MLRFVLGDEAFWKAIHRYAEVNQFRTVETADLRDAIEDSTGQGLNWFFDEWVHHGGQPEFEMRWSWDDAAKNAILTVKQTQKVDDLTPLFRMPVEIEIATGTSAEMKRIEVSKAEETFHFALDARPRRIVFDPRDWLLKKLKCDKSKEEWIDQLANCQHVMGRAQAVEALQSMKDHDDVEAVLIKAAKNDPFWGVRQEAVKSLAKLNNDAVRTALLDCAAKDSKSFVRRAAIEALGNFAHDDVRKALRTTIAEDKSYFAIAEALRALVKIDKEHVRDVLLAALDTPSHDHVVLKAACDGLADVKADAAVERLSKKLDSKLRPEERALVISALAKLKPSDEKTLEKLKNELGNDRTNVRRTAIETLIALNNPQAIAWLQEQRGREENNRMLRTIDEGIEKLRNGQKPVNELQRELDELRKKNRDLEERLNKVESKS
jgi:aminopeptidase N